MMRGETSKNLDSSGGPSAVSTPDGLFVAVRATAAAEAELVALARLCEKRPWSEKNIAAGLTAGAAFNFLLRRTADGSLCSFVLARLTIDELEIDKVGTHPDFRRRGCARFLLGHVVQEAGRRGGKGAFLEVGAGNTAALACYQSLGFRVDSVRKRYYESGEDAVVMSLVL
jgi:ribosomal-protein-alanine N-acetyltransferase